RFAVHLERHGLVELEMRAAVERQEFLPFDFELDRHDRSGLLAVNLEPLFSIAADFADFGILEDGSVEFRRLFGLRIEPQSRRELSWRELHDPLLSRPSSALPRRPLSARPRESGDPVLVLDSRFRGNERSLAVRSESLP